MRLSYIKTVRNQLEKSTKKGITLGVMANWWERDRGTFNFELYAKISKIKTQIQ